MRTCQVFAQTVTLIFMIKNTSQCSKKISTRFPVQKMALYL